MPVLPAAGEKNTLRRKVLKVFGSAFHLYDRDGRVVGFCKPKALPLLGGIRNVRADATDPATRPPARR